MINGSVSTKYFKNSFSIHNYSIYRLGKLSWKRKTPAQSKYQMNRAVGFNLIV
jgi:hypothetical protein